MRTAASLSDLPPPPPGKSGWPWTVAPPPPVEGGPWPPIGIVTPSYNQGAFIEATIRSVLLQGYQALEFFIEDGGSTDGTREIIGKYAPFLSGHVIETDRGQSHAINKGMARLQRAQWTTWLNSDDILLPGALHAVGEWAQRGTGAVAVVGRGYQLRHETGRRTLMVPKPDLSGETVRRWRTHSFMQPTCFFSVEAFRALGGVDESRHWAMDVDLWIRLGARGRFDLIEAELAQELLHGEAKTQKAMGDSNAEVVETLFRLGYPDDAKAMVRQLTEELQYMERLTSFITRNRAYQRFIRPAVRKMFGPGHFKGG